MMNHVRAAAFYGIFFALTFLMAVVCLPSLLFNRATTKWFVTLHAKFVLILLRVILNIGFEVRGAGNLPPAKYFVASKHQSAWETIAYLVIWPDPIFVAKRQLFFIPLYGWYALKLKMLPIERARGSASLRKLLAHAKEHVRLNRQLIIFPEGTRKGPFEAPVYKPGATALYQSLNVPCVPVALNSGVYWPRRSFLKRAGTIIVEIMPPIEPGLTREQFEARLQETIEGASRKLVAYAMEASRSLECTARL